MPASTALAMHDVAIIGAGPAGLSAALILGRCRRTVAMIDSGRPRNGASRGLHGYLTRDGTNPHALRRIGREQLEPYPNVSCRDDEVMEVRRGLEGFHVIAKEGSIESRLLLFATGRNDVIPEKPGFEKFFGLGVYHCPLCDGWEHRDQTLVLYSPAAAVELAIELRTWSDDIIVCADGSEAWKPADREVLERHGIRWTDAPVIELWGEERLQGVRLAGAPEILTSALFFCGDCAQKSVLPASLGCALDEEGSVRCQGHAVTEVPGVYVAGNVRGGLHLAIIAAAEGAAAAVAMNEALLDAGVFPPRGSV